MGLPYQAAVSGNTYKNVGMTILKAGNITSNSPVTQHFTQMESTAGSISYGTKASLSSGTAYSSGNLGTASAMTNFAYKQIPGEYIMRRYSSKVNGVANTTLRFAASSSSERMRSIPYLESARSLGSGVSTSWNYKTGAITKGTGAGESRSFGVDYAARPTNAMPGELTYKTGKLAPVADDYKPKTAP
jgi:hypothetical protein